MTDKKQDAKSMEKVGSRDAIRASRVKRTARIVGVSEDLVYKVLATDRENDDVEFVYHAIVDADNDTDNKLLAAVKNLIPFNQL
jgi:prolyl-tRNA editing enzyme YbaK/EbsC (Cys-tRNA(Pro) deacylase)